MLGSVRDRQVRLLGEGLDRARCLREQVKEFEPLRARRGLSDARELLEDRVLEAPCARLCGNAVDARPTDGFSIRHTT